MEQCVHDSRNYAGYLIEGRIQGRQPSPEDRGSAQDLAASPSDVPTLCPACVLCEGALILAESSRY